MSEWFKVVGQYGFGVKGGVEHVYHCTKFTLDALLERMDEDDPSTLLHHFVE